GARLGAALQPLSSYAPGRPAPGRARPDDEPAPDDRAPAEHSRDHDEADRTLVTTAPPPAPDRRIPAKPQVAGVSAAGLPVRKRRNPAEGTTPGRPEPRRPAAPAKKAPTRRDSRQVSDVLAAYAQGISRSADNRGPDATAAKGRTPRIAPADDTTQRSTS
ncbi:hypothetical protein DY218_17410, partial [Streptomyces triticagri]